MNIHECSRCKGCGYVTGSYHWEIPWTRWAPTVDHPNNKGGMLRPHGCPDCGGTGALLELDTTGPVLELPSRRGLPPVNAYADHVSLLLQAKLLRNLAN
jgi:hypothetical protein